jgi:phosphoglycerate kinase
MADSARQTLALARRQNCHLVLPKDVVVAAALEPGVATQTAATEAVPRDMMILDIGPRTVTSIGTLVEEARTLVWNGPLGAFETPPFDRGTVAVARKIGELTRAGRLLSIAGGGDTVAALDAAGITEELFYVSTAGGAFLEWLEGRELPGVAALSVAETV